MEREEIIMEECLALEHSLEETVGFQVLERGIIRVQAAGLQEVKFNLCLPLAQAIHILPDHFQVAHLAEADLQAITLMQVSAGSITINLPGAEGVSAGDPSSAISLIFQKYKKIAAVITGICVITAILSLLIQITKLGAAGDNERMRAMALKGIIFSGSALAVFGSLAAVVGIFWNAFI